MKSGEIKKAVKTRYDLIAHQTTAQAETRCCKTAGCCSAENNITLSDNYDGVSGYYPEADLGLGCGIPTRFAQILSGQRVLDLGSGAGNDCFVAVEMVGDSGTVTGLDFTESMLARAIENARKLQTGNVTFVKGDIEAMPFEENNFDVVISNCVLNLVPDKKKAFSEIWRVLKNGGHFCISDIVVKGSLPEELRHDAEMYAGCIGGAMEITDYIDAIEGMGFKQVTIHQLKPVELPSSLWANYMINNNTAWTLSEGNGLFSLTVSGYKTFSH